MLDALKSAGTDPPLIRASSTTIKKTLHFRPGDGPGRRLEGFTITSPIGSATDDIQLNSCAADIVGNIITGNQGMGIRITSSDNANPPTSSQITGNIVNNNGDTGISISGADATIDCKTGTPGDTTIILNNGLSSLDGSGVVLVDSNVTITDWSISGNRGDRGGGVRIEGGSVYVVSCKVTGNQAAVPAGTRNGGGVYAKNPGMLWLVNTTIHDNDALLNGGGAFFQGRDFSTAAADPCLPPEFAPRGFAAGVHAELSGYLQ